MNLSENEIGELLRKAPGILPPEGLRDKLTTQIQVPASSTGGRSLSFTRSQDPAWKRWLMLLVPSAVCLACVVVLAVQQMEIQDLQASIDSLTPPESMDAASAPAPAPAKSSLKGAVTSNQASPEAQPGESERLTALIQQLREEVQALEKLQKENADLRKALLTPALPDFTPEELAAMEQARERARSINCVNNLKQMGLAVRVWGLDNNDKGPPDIVCMSNELSTPKILVCPSDTAHEAAKDFSSFSMVNCSYEFLAPNGKIDEEPTRLLFRCPVHGHIGLCDGSVHSDVAKRHPNEIVQRDGKLYLERGNSPEPSPQPSSSP